MRYIIICVYALYLLTTAIFAEEQTQDKPTTINPTQQTIQPRYVYVNEKSSVVAGTLGAVAGFGIGNFYGENKSNGIIFLASELVGWGLFVTGWLTGDRDDDGFFERSELKDMSALTIIFFFGGLGTILTSRTLGAITAAKDAKDYNKKLEEKFRYITQINPFLGQKDNKTYLGLTVTY